MAYSNLIEQASAQMLAVMGIPVVVTNGNEQVYSGNAILAPVEKGIENNGQKIIKTCYRITLPANLTRSCTVYIGDDYYLVGGIKDGRDSVSYLRTYIITKGASQ